MSVVDFKDREALIPHTDNNHHHDFSGSESAFSRFGSSSCGSSSPCSYRDALLGSERDSTTTETETETGSEDDDFIAELTREMADYMLQEDENPTPNSDSDKSKEDSCNYNLGYDQFHGQGVMGNSVNSPSVKKSDHGFHSSHSYTGDQMQVYQLENQPEVRNNGSVGWGRSRKKMTESTQQLRKQPEHLQSRWRGSEFGKGGKGNPIPVDSLQVGSGMRAVFLGGSGSKNTSCGTGVFLPRATNKAPDPVHKKTGCSTVLIPTRVLQALEQHFNNREARSPSNSFAGRTNQQLYGVRDSTKEKSQVRAAMDHQETELPQEWIY